MSWHRRSFAAPARARLGQDEHGIALLFAVVVLATLGAMTVTAFALARSESSVGLAALARVQARGAAEAALAEGLLGWPGFRTPRTVGEEVPLVRIVTPGPAEGAARLRSLGGPIYAVRAEGIRRNRAGDAIGFVEMEMLVLLDSAGPDSLVRARAYPRGWRILP